MERESWLFPNLGTADGYPPPGTLTASAITGWMTCSRCWAHDNIEHLTKTSSVHFAIGTAVHHAGELAAKAIIEAKEVVAAECLEESMAVFDREALKEADRNGTERMPPPEAEIAEAKDVAARTVAFLLPELVKLYRERRVVAVEYILPLSLNPFPFPMTGRCDAISGGPKYSLPVVLSDIKTSSNQRRPDQNNRVQGGIYALFIERSGSLPQVVFDTVAKTKLPSLKSYGLGPEGEAYMTAPQLTTTLEIVVDIASAIADGYAAYLNGDWRTFRRCFPIGQGWNGKHDYDHGLAEAHPRLVVSWPGVAV